MIRSLRTVTAAILLVAGATVSLTSSAEAAPPLAGCEIASGRDVQAGSYITGYRYWYCDDGDIIPVTVRVQRYLQQGVYETVAEGRGEATYYCRGTLYNVYRTTGTSDFAILCT